MPTPSSPVHKRFDYDSLDSAAAVFVQQQTRAIQFLMKRSAEDIVEIGRRLIEVKQRLGHGRFGVWLSAEFEWTQETARRFMKVAQQFGQNPQIVDFAPSALYLLAEPSTPAPARSEAIARAEAGESITHKAALEIKQKYTPTPSQYQTKSTALPPATQSKPQVPQTEAPRQPTIKSKVSSEPFESGSQAESWVTAPSPSSSRPRAVEPTGSKPEILAIRPPAAAPEPEEAETLESRSQPAEKPAVGFVQPCSWWKLGEEHLLYCGEPTSPRFQERLPEQVALSLVFPPTKHWQLNRISTAATTLLALYTPYFQDQDYQLFRTTLRGLLMLYTEGGDAVVFSYLPEPDMPLLAHELDCRSFSVDPDPARCATVIRAWWGRGLRAEKVSGLRF